MGLCQWLLSLQCYWVALTLKLTNLAKLRQALHSWLRFVQSCTSHLSKQASIYSAGFLSVVRDCKVFSISAVSANPYLSWYIKLPYWIKAVLPGMLIFKSKQFLINWQALQRDCQCVHGFMSSRFTSSTTVAWPKELMLPQQVAANLPTVYLSASL